jgi:hypothetical protein
MVEKQNESLGPKGEKAFSDLCNKFDCEFLHIRQGLDERSSKMWRTGQKRPDFLVNIPDITSLFVDVKVRERKTAGIQSKKLASIKAFSVDFSDFVKMKQMENRIRISTWYAFFEMRGESDLFDSPAYLTPLSRVEKQLPDLIRSKMIAGEDVINWPRIFVPVHCMNQWSSKIDLSDRCQGCVEQFCKENPK